MIFLRPYENKDFAVVYEQENTLFHPMKESEFMSMYVEDELVHILMIDDGNQAIGYLIIWLDMDKSQIYSMVIFEPFQRQGNGYVALMLLEIYLKQKGVHEWSLEVRKSNHKALGLYQKMGFKTEATREGYYRDHEDALLMLKII